MLYRLLKFPAQIVLHLFCRHIQINAPGALNCQGPLLIACNHPNSFLDAIILCTLFKQPVYSLARGDVFKNKWAAFILKSLYIFPVYRTSEGVENLEHNYTTFNACIEIFKRNGIVLIFSEGLCINEWHLRPLKKGTARLAINSWKQNIPLKVMPVGLNYSSFRYFGKNIHIHFEDPITSTGIPLYESEGKAIQDFNKKLYHALSQSVYEINEKDYVSRQQLFNTEHPLFVKAALAIPALLGWLIHLPLYVSALFLIQKRFAKSGHFDSILVGLLFFIYPLYQLLVFTLCFILTHSGWSFALFPLMPFCAWAWLQLRKMVPGKYKKAPH